MFLDKDSRYQNVAVVENRKTRRMAAKGVFGGGLMVAGMSAAQAAVDVTAITAAGTDAAVVGAAVLVVLVGIFALKVVRRAL